MIPARLTVGVIAAALGTAALASGVAVPASGAGYSWKWGSIVDITPGDRDAYDPDVAVSADGMTQTIAFYREDSVGRDIAQVAVSVDGGVSWDDTSLLSQSGQDAAYVDVAMSADGIQQSVVWLRSDGSKYRVQSAASGDAGHSWDDTADLSAAGQNAAEPKLVVSGSGSSQVAVWKRSNGTNDIVQAAVSDDSGVTWDDTNLSSPGQNAALPAVAISEAGAVQAVAWQRSNGANTIVQVAVSDDSGLSWDDTTDLSVSGRSASQASLALSSNGQRQLVAWVRSNGTNTILQASSSDDTGNTWLTPADLSAPGVNAELPMVAVNDDGLQQTVAWKRGSDIQVMRSSDGGQTWSSAATISSGFPPGTNGPQISMSADGQQRVIAWDSFLGSDDRIAAAFSTDGGATWGAPMWLSAAGSDAYGARVAMSADGSRATATWYRLDPAQSYWVIQAVTATYSADPEPPAPLPPSAPRDVTATAGSASASVTWSAPASSGSFPVTDYQVTSQPGGKACLAKAPSLSCTVSGLTNGSTYTFTVKALNGAGWGPSSEPSNSVTPRGPDRPTIQITGTRSERDARRITVSGTSVGLVGEFVRPYLRFRSSADFAAGKARVVVDERGSFRWQRKCKRQVWVYFADGSTRSNAVAFPRWQRPI